MYPGANVCPGPVTEQKLKTKYFGLDWVQIYDHLVLF
jgi:hypothetical protein